MAPSLRGEGAFFSYLELVIGRHSSAANPVSVTEIIARLSDPAPTPTAPTPEPVTVPIKVVEGRLHPPPPIHIRWATVSVGALAASALFTSDIPATVEIPVVPTSHTHDILAAAPLTQEQINTDLAARAVTRTEREAAQQQAQAAQAAADTVELERRAAEAEATRLAEEEAERAKQAAAEAAEVARQRAAVEEASRESLRAAQEAAKRSTQVVTTPSPSQAAQDLQSTVERPLTPIASSGTASIVPGGRITSLFGMRWGVLHAGIDIAAPLGTPIYSPISGVVRKAGPTSGFGNAIYIEDAAGDVWLFGHMSRMDVVAGDRVSVGTLIARVGNEGQSTGPHVHIERHIGGMNGKKVDPAPRLGL